MTVGLPNTIRIGIDCGGTNTDAVILDLTPGATQVVLASTKTPTTPEVTHGIRTATSTVLKSVPESVRSEIQSINIGTTHFVNALIQRSEDRLERVAVIRLCGPFSRRTPPFAGFPYELREILQGPHFFAEGGLQIDGSEISKVDEAEIQGICEKIKQADIRAVAISSVYSPIDFTLGQEQQVESIVKRCIPGVFTTCSKRVANIGLLERENATILNTSLLPFAHVTVEGFTSAAEAMGLPCPVFVTGNDGTLLSLEQAATLPIRTFSSGPTNSMRGAGFLAALHDPDAKRETALVVDIGGTTTEVGVLLPTGFPRQAASHHELCGVTLNFAMPHVTSIGLGGGSLIRTRQDGKVTVGPESVGYKLLSEGMVFGGNVLTATDIAVAAGNAPNVGNPAAVASVETRLVEGATARIQTMLELCLDSMKTSNEDVPVYLVGGGAILAPSTLRGISKVHRFPFYDCANAVGAAIAQVAGSIDTVEELGTRSVADVQRSIERKAIDRAIEEGAKPSTVQIVESEAIPIAYTAGRCRFFVKATGDWAGSQSKLVTKKAAATERSTIALRSNPRRHLGLEDVEWTPEAVFAYRPRVEKGVWYLSEIDLEWLCIGTYILGCGGGGDPTHDFLACRDLIRAGDEIRVIDLGSLPSQDLIGWGGGLGSPEVSLERLLGEEYNQALVELLQFMKIDKLAALAALEIGGSNGMINLLTGAKSVLDLPIVDGDFMGRAYPTGWQTTPNVYDDSGRGQNLLPTAIASGDGNSMFMTTAKTDRFVDVALRAACVEMGTHVGAAMKPLTAEFCHKAMIKNTVSQSWRLGRAVMLAQKSGQIGNIDEILVEALGGPSSARVLFAGKITEVHRRVYKGHSIGEVVIQAIQQDDGLEEEQTRGQYRGVMNIPFKNENLYCEHVVDGKSTIVATVPDLIAVLDAGNGRALGTPDYKYGQRVLVLGVTAAPQWTDTPRGLEMGDLRAFGYVDIPYKPLGSYVKPRSVIEEYNTE